MSEYPYEDKIHSKDRVNYKSVYSSDGIRIGKVEAAFSDSFVVKTEKQNKEVKYDIPRLEIASIIKRTITLKSRASDVVQKYETSSVEKGL